MSGVTTDVFIARRSFIPRVTAAMYRDCRGATAIEFGIVALPFLMFIVGIVGVGLYFFTTFSLEHGVERASRSLRTGQAQQTGITPDQFKTSVCSYLPSFVDCGSKLRVNVLNFTSSAAINSSTIPKCLDGSNALVSTSVYEPGSASQIVLVLACYEWDFANKIPFFKLGNMKGGGMLIQAATTFRTEPYAN
jgi:Flp pilus assembly protein TadG